MMNDENEYIVTTVQDYPVSEIASGSETSVTAAETLVTTVETSVSSDYDFNHLQQNSDGILLMTTGIFFLLVIYLTGKLLGNFFTM